jgi:hypothetical protein
MKYMHNYETSVYNIKLITVIFVTFLFELHMYISWPLNLIQPIAPHSLIILSSNATILIQTVLLTSQLKNKNFNFADKWKQNTQVIMLWVQWMEFLLILMLLISASFNFCALAVNSM